MEDIMEATLRNEQALNETQVKTVAAQATNPLANVWLLLMGVMLVGTLLCTAVLVAWPIIASMVAG
jgi:hypothetical protein